MVPKMHEAIYKNLSTLQPGSAFQLYLPSLFKNPSRLDLDLSRLS